MQAARMADPTDAIVCEPHADQRPAIAHGSRPRSPLRPAEALGRSYHFISEPLENGLFSPSSISGLLPAQLDRVDTERVGELIHGAFDREDAARLAGAAHMGRSP
jgi:hypothetical protein